jgi:hypothetical protein
MRPPAALRDISEIGLACTSSHAIPEMTLVGLDFALPGASDRHLVKGAVVRCEPLGKGEEGLGPGRLLHRDVAGDEGRTAQLHRQGQEGLASPPLRGRRG